MGVIAFSKQPEETWQVAGWAFRQVLDDAAQRSPNDTELRKQFELAKLYDGLCLYTLKPELANRVVILLRKTIEDILFGTMISGTVSQPYGNPETQNQFKAALRELLTIIPESETTDVP